MNKPNVSKFIKSAQIFASKHSPEILTWIGIAGMVTSTVLAVKVTPKALMCIQDAEHNKGDQLTAAEKAKACWKCYIPVAVTSAASIACLVGASSVNLRRNAALATAYKLSETALTEYREKVIETVGEKKEQMVREKINKDHLEKNPVTSSNVIVTGNGDTLCYDSLFGRYFNSDIDKIKRAVNELNRELLMDMYVSLNDFYDQLDLDHIDIGDDLGWNVDDGLIDIDFGSQLASDGRPCITLNYTVAPRYGYSRLT